MDTKSHLKLTMIDSGAPAPGALEGARRATGKAPGAGGGRASTGITPDPEVKEQKTRRYFTAKYKLRILQESETFTQPGELGPCLDMKGYILQTSRPGGGNGKTVN